MVIKPRFPLVLGRSNTLVTLKLWLPLIAVLVGMLALTGVPTLLAATASPSESSAQNSVVKPAGAVRVAFLGDQGLGANSRAVLRIIREEDADMVVHSGDFDYGDNPTAWDNQISNLSSG